MKLSFCFSRSFRFAAKQTKSALRQGMLALLVVQLAAPQIVLLADEPKAPEQSAGLAEEVQSGIVRAVSVDFVGQGRLRFNKQNGVHTTDFLISDPKFKRPLILLSDFDRQVRMEVREGSKRRKTEPELVFSMGHTDSKTGTFISTVEYAIPGVSVIGDPLTDDSFITLVTEVGGRADAIRMASKDMVVGNDSVRGSGFYSEVPLSLALSLKHLPAEWSVQGIETWSPVSAPERLHRWDTFETVEDTTLLGVGDKVLRVLDGEGKPVALWVPNEVLGEGYVQRMIETALVALQDQGGYSAAEIAQVNAFLASVADANKESVEAQTAIEASQARLAKSLRSSELATASLRTLNLPWMISHLTRSEETQLNADSTEEKVRRNKLERLFAAQRQRFEADPSPDAPWSRTHGLIESARERGKLGPVGPQTKAWGTLALAEQKKLALEGLPIFERAARRVQSLTLNFAKAVLTPSRVAFLGSIAGITGASYALDSSPSQALAAIGTRIIETSQGTVFQNLVQPVTELGKFAADNLSNGSEGLTKIGLLSGGIGSAIGVFFLLHLGVWGFGRLAKGSQAPFTWKGITKDSLTRLMHLYCTLQLSFQERVLSRVQPNLYPYVYNTGDKSRFWRGMSFFNSKGAAETVERQDKDRLQVTALASRLSGLLIAADEEEVSPELLAMADSEPQLESLLSSILVSPEKRARFLELRKALRTSLLKLYAEGDGAVANAELSKESYERYLSHAREIKRSAATPAAKGMLARLWSTYVGWGSRSASFVGGFVRDNLLGFTSGIPAHKYANQEIGENVRSMQMGMATPDILISTASSGALNLGLYTLPTTFAAASEKGLYVSVSLEQAASWAMTPQSDILAGLSEAAVLNNPYGPLAALQFDPSVGGLSRAQTLEEGFAAVMQGLTDPDPSKPGIFKAWLGYMRATIQGHQVRAIMLGGPIFGGLLVAGNFSPAYSFALAASIAYFVAARKISVQGDGSVGYATVWPIANTVSTWMRDSAAHNHTRLVAAAGLLDSPDLAEVRQGALAMKELYNEGQAWFSQSLPDRFNIPSSEYTVELGKALLVHQKENGLPLPTAPSAFLDGSANTAAVLASVVMYFGMFKNLLNDPSLTLEQVLGEFGKAAAWFGATGAGIYTLAKVTPKLANAATPLKRGLSIGAQAAKSCVHSLLGVNEVNTK